MTNRRCGAVTRFGWRCVRTATFRVRGVWLCATHAGAEEFPAIAAGVVAEPEPAAIVRLRAKIQARRKERERGSEAVRRLMAGRL